MFVAPSTKRCPSTRTRRGRGERSSGAEDGSALRMSSRTLRNSSSSSSRFGADSALDYRHHFVQLQEFKYFLSEYRIRNLSPPPWLGRRSQPLKNETIFRCVPGVCGVRIGDVRRVTSDMSVTVSTVASDAMTSSLRVCALYRL